MSELVSWDVLVWLVIAGVCAQALFGAVWALVIWPWSRGRKITELMLLALCATSAPVAIGALGYLLTRRPGDLAVLVGVVLLWIGQLPFMFAGLPVLDWLLDKQRRQAEKSRELEKIRDGQA